MNSDLRESPEIANALSQTCSGSSEKRQLAPEKDQNSSCLSDGITYAGSDAF